MEPKVSVIIPCYNPDKTIAECLTHIIESDYNNIEIIVVDDCSTDGSANIIKNFPCKLIRSTKNKGPAHARNIGAKKASGSILLFLDSDVLIKKDAISIMVRDFKEKPNISGVVGIYSKKPANKSPFNWYIAIKKYSDWTSKKQKEYTAFQTRLGGIKKEVFLKLEDLTQNTRRLIQKTTNLGINSQKNIK